MEKDAFVTGSAFPLSRREMLLLASAAVHASGSAHADQPHHTVSHSSSLSAPPTLRFLSHDQALDVEDLAALILPTDDTPGAREAGVISFIDSALATFDNNRQQLYISGIAEVRQRLRELVPEARRIVDLSPAQQTKLLEIIASSEFFAVLRAHTIMGFLGNQAYGGNRNAIGWKLIGFEDRFAFAPPFGYYDSAREPA